MSDDSAALAPHTHHLRVQRTARYYTLGAEQSDPRAIWFVLHGYGQLAATFIRFFADLAQQGILVVAPEALNRYYLVAPENVPARDRPVGATWMTREDRESEIADYVEYLDALHDEVVAGRQPSVTVLGFSQGTATATRWMVNGRARIGRLVLWGGLMPPEIDVGRARTRLGGMPVTIVVGSRDHYISDDLLAAERARLERGGVAVETVRFDGGHVVSRSVFPRLLGEPLSDASDR